MHGRLQYEEARQVLKAMQLLSIKATFTSCESPLTKTLLDLLLSADCAMLLPKVALEKSILCTQTMKINH